MAGFETALLEKRLKLDEIDHEIVALYEARMRLCREIGALKRENGSAIYDETRENAVLDSRGAMLSDKSLRDGLRALFRLLMEQSKSMQ